MQSAPGLVLCLKLFTLHVLPEQVRRTIDRLEVDVNGWCLVGANFYSGTC